MRIESRNRFIRIVSSAAQSFSFAMEANKLAQTSEAVFKGRGTTRQQALRNLIDRL